MAAAFADIIKELEAIAQAKDVIVRSCKMLESLRPQQTTVTSSGSNGTGGIPVTTNTTSVSNNTNSNGSSNIAISGMTDDIINVYLVGYNLCRQEVNARIDNFNSVVLNLRQHLDNGCFTSQDDKLQFQHWYDNFYQRSCLTHV